MGAPKPTEQLHSAEGRSSARSEDAFRESTLGSGDPIASPPPGRARLITSAAIGAYLAWQILLPLSYYGRTDKDDERFAWRMFSVRSRVSKTCAVRSFERDQTRTREVPLDRVLYSGWTTPLQSGRGSVIEKFLQSRCQADPSLTEVRFERRCEAAGAADLVSSTLRCGSGQVDGSGGRR